MRINNPRRLAGFSINDTADEKLNQLITLKQMQNAIKILDDKFTMLLAAKGADIATLSSTMLNQFGSVNQTITENTEAIQTIQNDVASIVDHLNGKVVSLIEKPFTWVHDSDDVEENTSYWTYDYASPIVEAGDERIYERIIAVYSSTGGKEDVDISVNIDSNDIYHQTLNIKTPLDDAETTAVMEEPWSILVAKTIIGLA